MILLSHQGGGSLQEEEGRDVEVTEAILAIIGVISIPILAVVATFVYWIIMFLKHGDG